MFLKFCDFLASDLSEDRTVLIWMGSNIVKDLSLQKKVSWLENARPGTGTLSKSEFVIT